VSASSPIEVDDALSLVDVSVIRDGARLLGPIDWRVAATDRWIVLGANGCGKSTLLRVASMHLHPSRGSVHLLGEELGRTDVRRLRKRVGYASAALAGSFRPTITCRDVVMTAKNAALEPWWHEYSDADRERAEQLLEARGCGDHADRTFVTLSSGERQRVLLARTLMTDPGVVLLDEPTAALDVSGRELLVEELGGLAADPASPAMALVTHHVEEIPAGFTHVLLMKRGVAVASGPLDTTLDDESLSETFETPLRIVEIEDRRFGIADRR
jgi:iron complex transport system ATP-binding protein